MGHRAPWLLLLASLVSVRDGGLAALAEAVSLGARTRPAGVARSGVKISRGGRRGRSGPWAVVRVGISRQGGVWPARRGLDFSGGSRGGSLSVEVGGQGRSVRQEEERRRGLRGGLGGAVGRMCQHRGCGEQEEGTPVLV